MGPAKRRIGPGVLRIEGDRPLEQRPCLVRILGGKAVAHFPRPQHRLVGIEILRFAPRAAWRLRARNVCVQRHSDGARHFVLDHENVRHLPVVALRPEVCVARGVDQLRGDAHAISELAHAALEHVAGAQFPPDGLDVDRPPLVDESRIPGDHEQPRETRQVGDQVLGDAVAEVLLLRIVAEVGEGKHRDHRPAVSGPGRASLPRLREPYARCNGNRQRQCQTQGHGRPEETPTR